MKKIILILTTFFILLIPINVSASSRSYNITDLSINAEIKENGDVYVDKTFTYNFNGDFNGIYVDLNLKGSEGYDISEVIVIDSTGTSSLALKDDGSENSYEILNYDNKIQIKIYSQSSNEEKKFNIKYTAKNVAEKYKDYSSLYWSFYTASYDAPVNKVNLNLKLNNSPFNTEDLYYIVFGDGSFNSETTKDRIIINGNNLTSDIGIKLRFQKDYLNLTTIDTYYDESSIGEDKFNPFFLVPSFSLIVIIALAFYLVYKRNKKLFNKALEEYRSEYLFTNEDYLFFPPSNESPTIVAYIYNKNNISWSLVPSTLLYLANIGLYKLNTSLDKDSKLENIIFTRIKDVNDCEYPHLKILVNWFKKYENQNNEFNLLSIKKLIENSSKKAKKFNNSYWDFINQIRIDGRRLNLYTTIRDKEVLNNEAYDQYLKWDAYKKHLLSLIENKDILNIKESIIYSSALGIDYIDLDIYPKENTINQNSYYYFYMNNYLLFDKIHSSTEEKISNSSNNGGNNSFNSFSSGSSFNGGGGGSSGGF
ncbi:DUF2207 domain-containing protein [Clostridium sp. AL.422]|uniref:DUF2207 domain-containing protein n=1 Tax=Clostridium TaxID=1485 RepID=UPI00293DC8BA|nr:MULTISPECIES: DUF2207 domain-containing protein [unclassified Clostridium]MDV4152759.1 DUF2207 domain-containing protein [Clostridium sp. AL.422]